MTQTLIGKANQCYNTQVNDLLLLALTRTLTEWQQSSQICVELEGHGREVLDDSFDLNQTVGWFTTTYPALLSLHDSEFGSQIKSIKEQLRAIPNKGLGYGVLKHFCQDETPQSKSIDGLFNYLGKFDSIDMTANGLISDVTFADDVFGISQERSRFATLSTKPSY